MIDYELTEQEKQLKAKTAELAIKDIAPQAKKLDEATKAESAGLMKANLKKLAQAGVLEAGLADGKIDLIGAYVAGEEIAKACAATYMSARATSFLVGGAVTLFGTADQKSAYLAGIKAADTIGALAYSEADSGTDLGAIATTAVSEADKWLISGTKDIVLNAPIADVFLVLAWTDKAAGLEKGLSLFIVEKTAAGLTAGAPLDTMGLRGAPIASLTLDKCAAKAILGGTAGQGFEQVTKLLEMGRVTASAMCVGVGTACMEKATAQAKARKTFGKPIGAYQEVGFKLADMFTQNDLGRTLSLRAAWAYNMGDSDAPILAACAKLFAGEGVTLVANLAMQVFAGHGYLKGTDIERLYRDARFGEICEGTTEMMRVTIAKPDLDRFARR
ncbi:MAG: acyl-CoA dehydrogenase family protein [Syntrophaceae bacterium]